MDASHLSRPEAGTETDSAIASVGSSLNLRLLIEQLDRPLDRIDWKGKQSTSPEHQRSSGQEHAPSERQHLGDLQRAREAAQAAFGVRPSLTDRMLASHILSKADMA